MIESRTGQQDGSPEPLDKKGDSDRFRAWRLVSHRMGTQPWQRPEQAVEWMGGIQAQDYRGAKWSIALRTEACSDEDVERAIQDRRIVRTWMYRGTLHFVGVRDLSWLTALLAPRTISKNARRYRQLELDDAAFEKSQQVLRRTLAAKGSLTRSEIKARFERESVPAAGQQVPYLLQRAALDGVICLGPQRGHEPTYVLVSDWVGVQRPTDPDEALQRLAARYFASHGPATWQDLSWWAGLSAGQARTATEAASGLEPIDVDGAQYWATCAPVPTSLPARGHLLPRFDDYLLGYKDRSMVLDPAWTKQVNAGGGMPRPTVVVNGEVLGTWSRKIERQELIISIEPFRDLGSRECELIREAVNQFGRFQSMQADVRCATGPVS
jgi:hypothetical protein